VNGEVAVGIGLNVWVFTSLLFVVGIAWGFGKASVFKFLSDEYSDNIGVASGIVGLAGGMGGFFLPIMFGALIDYTGINSVIFMLLYGATSVSLIWMHYTFAQDKQKQDMMIAKGHVMREYEMKHENLDSYATAKAAVDQAELIENFYNSYQSARERAQAEAERMKRERAGGRLPSESLE
jgi:NNP family nitrate/nitrite transporter-like MFS transporter